MTSASLSSITHQCPWYSFCSRPPGLLAFFQVCTKLWLYCLSAFAHVSLSSWWLVSSYATLQISARRNCSRDLFLSFDHPPIRLDLPPFSLHPSQHAFVAVYIFCFFITVVYYGLPLWFSCLHLLLGTKVVTSIRILRADSPCCTAETT